MSGLRRWKLLSIPVLIVVALAGVGSYLVPSWRTASDTTTVTSISPTTAMPVTETSRTYTTGTTTTPEISLEYTVSILDPRSGMIHVKGSVHNMEGDQIILGRGETGGDREVPAMNNFTPAYSVGKSTRFLQVLALPVTKATAIKFQYDVDLRTRVSRSMNHWYLGGQFGAVEPEYLFLFPIDSSRSIYLPIRNVTVHFALPDGWDVLTHWNVQEDHYCAHSTADFILGFLGFGRFERMSRNIGGVNVTVAFVGTPLSQQTRLSERVFTLYEYYTRNVGPISKSTYLPRDRYIVLSVPVILGSHLLSYREAAYGYFDSDLGDEQATAHHIFHEWNGNSGAFYGDFWVTEGLTSYYEFHALLNAGSWTKHQYFEGLISDYDEYLQKFKDADAPLEPSREGVDLKLYYRKGAIVGYLLNEAMTRVTDGGCSMDDLMRYLFERWAMQNRVSDEWYDSAYRVSGDDVLRAVNDLTGHDFGAFFKAYIFGMSPLPLQVLAGELRIRYDEIPSIPEL